MSEEDDDESGSGPCCSDCGKPFDDCRCVDYPDDSGESDRDDY